MDDKLTAEQIRATAAILHRVVTTDAIKLRWGGMKREELRQTIARGETPSGYRVDWLRETRRKLVDALQSSAEAFNLRYPHDRISVADMTDALTSTLHQFQEAIRRATATRD